MLYWNRKGWISNVTSFIFSNWLVSNILYGYIFILFYFFVKIFDNYNRYVCELILSY